MLGLDFAEHCRHAWKIAHAEALEVVGGETTASHEQSLKKRLFYLASKQLELKWFEPK